MYCHPSLRAAILRSTNLVGRVYRWERALEAGHVVLVADGREVTAATASQKIVVASILNGGSVVARCGELVGVLAQQCALAAQEVALVCGVGNEVEVGITAGFGLAWQDCMSAHVWDGQFVSGTCRWYLPASISSSDGNLSAMAAMCVERKEIGEMEDCGVGCVLAIRGCGVQVVGLDMQRSSKLAWPHRRAHCQRS